MEPITLNVNGQSHTVEVDPETPLLYVLRNDLGLKGPKFGCGQEQCNACKVLVDGRDVPSCKLPVKQVGAAPVVTIEGLAEGDELHPLQEAFLEEQAGQCAYCIAGMIIGAQGLLNRVRYPTDDDIREALDENLCRCGVYDRVRRAIKLRIGRPEWDPIYEVRDMPPMPLPDTAHDLPRSIQQTPSLDSWVRIDESDTVTVFTGKSELGQGIATVVAQIAAEELELPLARVRVINADTGQTPDEGLTAGSMSTETTGNAMRFAAADARLALLSMAKETLGSETPIEKLAMADGTITDPASGKTVTFWELMGGKRFERQITGAAEPKDPADYRMIGQPEKRVDLRGKVSGVPTYVHDLDLPGMLHARVVRPPGYDARLTMVDGEAIYQMPGVVEVVLDGSFLAVVAEREEQAVWARDALEKMAIWDNKTALPAEEELYDHLLNAPAETHLVVNGTPVEEPVPEIQTPPQAAQTLSATYRRPYVMHASLGPSAAAALWEEGHLTVWSHTQGVYILQAALASVLGIEPAQIHVIHMDGAGTYGHNGADDVALDAALAARAVPGRPVLLKWMRADEHGWEPYGPAMVMQMNASLDAEGRVIDWNHDVWSYAHATRAWGGGEGSGLLAAWYLAKPFARPVPRTGFGPHFGGYRNADPKYAFERKRVVNHFAPGHPLRVSALRSLGAYANVFAIESFMDELALAAGVDPVEFRLRHLDDPRAKAVIEAAVEKAGWEPRARPSGEGQGRGFAFAQYKNRASYVAVVADVTVDRESGVIHLKHAVVAADSGQIVNPDGLSNQLEGGLVQAASWTLVEQVRFARDGITSRDWETYPILHFSAAPVIEVVLLNRPGMPFLGSGEATQNPTPAAIANAVFDAVGIRLRDVPFTPERVLAALGEKA